MLNRGTSTADPTLIGTHFYTSGGARTRASFFLRAASSVTDLPQLNNDQFATGKAGASSSIGQQRYVGSMSNGGSTLEYPAQWTGTDPYAIVRNYTLNVPGVWNDVNRNLFPVGTIKSDDRFKPVTREGTDAIRLLPTGGYDSGDARGVNIQKTVGGRVFDHVEGTNDEGIGVPAIWTYDSALDLFSLRTIIGATNWPFGRNGVITAITDNTGDVNGPYAVGYMFPQPGVDPDPELGPAPFVWSLGLNKVRFFPVNLPSPMQVSNYMGGSNVITPMHGATYTKVFLGDPNVATNGGIVDFGSFVDPEELALGGVGVNDAFQFGGDGFEVFVGVERFPAVGVYIAGSENGWGYAASSDTYALTTGTVYAGALSNLQYADGKNTQITGGPGFGSGSPRVALEVSTSVTSATTRLSLRYNFGRLTGGLVVKAQFYNWVTQTWDTDTMGGEPPDEVFQTGICEPTGTVSDYIQQGNNGLVKARILAYAVDPFFSNVRRVAFEHARILSK